MKLSILTLSLGLFTAVSLNAQKLKTKKERSNFHKTIYQLDKETKKQHGWYYKINDSSGDTLVIGQHDQGRRVGEWQFMDLDGKKFLSFNYDTNSSKPAWPVGSPGDSIPILHESEFVLQQVDRAPVFVGYKGKLQDEMIRILQEQNLMNSNWQQGLTVLSMIIDPRGNSRVVKVEQAASVHVAKALVNALKLVKGHWIPATLDNKPVTSKIFLVHTFYMSTGQYSSLPETPQIPDKAGVFYFGTSARQYSVKTTRTGSGL
ncbi:hypothetical protein PP178_05440 [Zeaxanthinibacter sp. PT1]|uniref:hypothetical protein n=1 Tax=Zeaxanthinibacter TaxID=561554 RepID=UPI0023490A39|nr:hypothetical protein [Zeaxanthinibacter sp. PT1]MDC6350987.1 hypothetical protein [Zeaxanthinibacter sp. PT1]